MSKDETKDEWEIVDEVKVKETVALLVDFLEEKKVHPRIVVVAMQFIQKKITDHYEMEIREVTIDGTESLH
jgi:hypothetical protein